MPGPPPPPPAAPPPMMAPPPVFSQPKGGADDRSALLTSIRQGKKLKKTVTVDKSGPLIPGKFARISHSFLCKKHKCKLSRLFLERKL